MRKGRQFKAGRCYHLVSRVAHRAFFFDEEELLAKISRLYRGTRQEEVLKEWKTLKHHYTSSYNGRHDHNGTMWEGRYHHRESKPTTEAMSAVAAYIDCNPCEGWICRWPTEYKWCSWTAATEGDEHCRDMYRFIYGETVEDGCDWAAIVSRHEKAICRRNGEIEEEEKSGRVGIFLRDNYGHNYGCQ